MKEIKFTNDLKSLKDLANELQCQIGISLTALNPIEWNVNSEHPSSTAAWKTAWEEVGASLIVFEHHIEYLYNIANKITAILYSEEFQEHYTDD